MVGREMCKALWGRFPYAHLCSTRKPIAKQWLKLYWHKRKIVEVARFNSLRQWQIEGSRATGEKASMPTTAATPRITTRSALSAAAASCHCWTAPTLLWGGFRCDSGGALCRDVVYSAKDGRRVLRTRSSNWRKRWKRRQSSLLYLLASRSPTLGAGYERMKRCRHGGASWENSRGPRRDKCGTFQGLDLQGWGAW